MTQTIQIGELQCLCCLTETSQDIAYILYPEKILADWIEDAAGKYGTTIVIITGMDWQNDLTPWPAKGVPAGSPDFKGNAPEFMATLLTKVVPSVEKTLGIHTHLRRSLIGESLSGLFTLWEWLQDNTFDSIASLSGSFWYEGFVEWVDKLTIPDKKGMAYFLLGNRESHSRVKAFDSVAVNTHRIISILDNAHIATRFELVPGNHYANPIPRLDHAFAALFR